MDDSRPRKMLSIVVPAYNEEDNVEPLYHTITSVMLTLADRYDHEVLFIDDHSTDGTFQRLEHLARQDHRVRVIRFSRNFGFQRAVHTGFIHAMGDAAIQLDCDFQDPPELIPEFVRKWEENYQVVYGIRRSRKEGWWISTLRKIFYRLIRALSEDSLPPDAGDFRLIDRIILDELKKIDDSQPYVRGAIATLGFNQIGIPYDRGERTKGVSKFPFRQLVRLALDGICNHSTVPLRIATYIGMTISLITFLGAGVYFIGRVFFGQEWPAGFATTSILILLSLSLNALFLGIIGEYLGRIYLQVKRRPHFIIEREIKFSAKRD